ncbi:acyltransferase family protein, partial [Vibrio sp. V37_P2S8PM304]
MTFRKDINGLRALAVIAVLLFHLDFNWIPGGFAGVDVFFVISGFLMTGIIVNRLENQSFSLMGFYSDRAKRIFPPLVFVTAFSLILGYFLLLKPTDYANLATHVYSSLGFFSNIIYWLDSGYFDSTPKDKWLLHTWSLSVEWQFYILYPVLVILINRLFPKNGIRIT